MRIFTTILLIGSLIGCLGAQTPITITNPGFEDDTSGWNNTITGSYEYYAPVEGEYYATRTAGEDYTIQQTGQIIEAGQSYSLTLWARSIFDDEHTECLRDCDWDDLPYGNTAKVIADIGFFFDSVTINLFTRDVDAPFLKGDAARLGNDDGGNIWLDGDYRHSFADHHMYQSAGEDPILDPWTELVGSHYNQIQDDLGWAVGPVIVEDQKYIYGTIYKDYQPGLYSSLTVTHVLSEDPPDYTWSDPKLIMNHYGDEDPWIIDAHGYYDESTGKLWMSWGGGTVYVSEMDPSDGMLIGHPEDKEFDNHPEGTHHAIAHWLGFHGWKGDGWSAGWMEGPALYKYNGYWYCLASYGNLSKNYSIRMGRGSSPTGPFLDKQGLDMMEFDEDRNVFGNSFLLGAEGGQVVPGHPHIWQEDDKYYIGYDYHKIEGRDLDYLGIRLLHWVDDWPTIWTPISISFKADDHPEAIGKNLGIGFKNSGQESSVLAVDHFSLFESTTAGADSLDTEAPSVPGTPVSTGFTTSSIQLVWESSTDNIAVAGYRLYMDNLLEFSTSDTTAEITGLLPETSYTFYVQAYDPAGYTSERSGTLTVETRATGIRSNHTIDQNPGVYPNPVTTELCINSPGKEEYYMVYSSRGNLVIKGRGNRVDVSCLVPGLYFVQTEGSRAIKFIKE